MRCDFRSVPIAAWLSCQPGRSTPATCLQRAGGPRPGCNRQAGIDCAAPILKPRVASTPHRSPAQAAWADAGNLIRGRLAPCPPSRGHGVSWRHLLPISPRPPPQRAGVRSSCQRRDKLPHWADAIGRRGTGTPERVAVSGQSMLSRAAPPLVQGSLDPARDTVGSAGLVRCRLTVQTTTGLLTRVARGVRCAHQRRPAYGACPGGRRLAARA